ncbi:MAG: hypothetical protein ACRDQ4_26380 [Pseudonocardiaceae bacterium]
MDETDAEQYEREFEDYQRNLDEERYDQERYELATWWNDQF